MKHLSYNPKNNQNSSNPSEHIDLFTDIVIPWLKKGKKDGVPFLQTLFLLDAINCLIPFFVGELISEWLMRVVNSTELLTRTI